MDRFWSKVEKTESCWNWTGAVGIHGYGFFRLPEKKVLAHRFIYEKLVGNLIADLEIDHVCRNRLCVNPAHLEQVSKSENRKRAVPFRKKAVKSLDRTHCLQGHIFNNKNTIWLYAGCRICAICSAE